jgi:single-strand DNA-binding protein
MNKVQLIGHVTRDLELRSLPNSSQAVTNFTVATNESWTDQAGKRQEHTEWNQCVAFGKLAETCAKYLTKGRLVYVEGRLRTREFNSQTQGAPKQQRTEIVAGRVMFLGKPEAGEPSEGDEG